MAVMIEPPKDDEVDDVGIRLARVEVWTSPGSGDTSGLDGFLF